MSSEIRDLLEECAEILAENLSICDAFEHSPQGRAWIGRQQAAKRRAESLLQSLPDNQYGAADWKDAPAGGAWYPSVREVCKRAGLLTPLSVIRATVDLIRDSGGGAVCEVMKDDERQLAEFYQVSTKSDLIAAQSEHIERLQSKLPDHQFNRINCQVSKPRIA